MTIYPQAQVELLPVGANDKAVRIVGTIAHIAVSESSDLYNFFKGRADGIESHFYILRNGTVKQYRDTALDADAQAKGNAFYVGNERRGYLSYETQGMGDGTWTQQQLDAIVALNRWSAATHGHALTRCQSATSTGLGYHRMFPEWNPNGHSCPGDQRVEQFNTYILPTLATGDDDMTPDQDAILRDTFNRSEWNHRILAKLDPDNGLLGAWGTSLPEKDGVGPAQAAGWLQDTRIILASLDARLAAIEAHLAALA